MLNLKSLFLLFICLSFIGSVSADFSYEDLTFSHSLRCSNSTHAVDLLHLNDSFAYTDMNPSKCFELGGVSKLNFVDILLANFPIILFALVILMVIFFILRRGRKEVMRK